MKKILNKRLETLSAFIKENEIVLDIGCDHGFLGIYLTLNRRNIKVISSDINTKPLMKAKDNIHKYGLDNKIETRLGNGLDIMTSDINTIIISGMGAISIINILKDINKYPNVHKLVLSPNNDFEYFRKSIIELGFMITKEEMVLENGKYYLISECIKGKSDIDCFFGKLDLTNDIVIDYYKYIYNRNEIILKKTNNKYLIMENFKIKEKIFQK